MRLIRRPAPLLWWSSLVLLVPSLAYGQKPDAPGLKDKDDKIKESSDKFDCKGKTIAVDRFEPVKAGKRPIVLLIHGADGLQFDITRRYYRAVAQELARNGYAVFLVHYFDRTGTKFGDLGSNVKHFGTWTETLAEAITWAGKQDNVDPKRVGVVGMSLGGSLALGLGSTDSRISAVIDVFGGATAFVAKPEKLPPTLILHGDADPIVNVEESRRLEKMLKDKKRTYEIQIYKGQGHGFLGDAAKDALKRTVTFLDKYVKEKKE